MSKNPPHQECREKILDAARSHDHPQRIAQTIRPWYASWGHNYVAMLARLMEDGAQIAPVSDWRPLGERDERTVYLRHDIHWTGIPGALCTMDIERKLGIRATYYITWDYRKHGRDHRDDYLLLKKFGKNDFEYGLHESCLDEAVFDLDLDGDESPEKTKDAVNAMIERDGLRDTDPSALFERSENGLWMLREPDALPDGLGRIVRRAREILGERIAGFREAWGTCRSVNAHGGYAFTQLRALADLPVNGSFMVNGAPDDASGPRKDMLWQSFRMAPQHVMDEFGIEVFCEAAANHDAATNGRASEVWDARFKDAQELSTSIDEAAAASPSTFVLTHPDLWDEVRYEDLVDIAIERSRRSSGPPEPGPYRHAIYRSALSRAMDPHMARTAGDAWREDPAALINYGYRVGNFEDRGRRLDAVMEFLDFQDMLKGARMIDLGSGSGTVAAYISNYRGVAERAAFDIDTETLSLQQTVADDLGWGDTETAEGNFSTWIAPEEPRDIVMSYGAFEFFFRNRDVRHIFQQVGRALRPGGVFIANVWNHHYPYQGYSRAKYVQHLPTQPLRLLAARLLGKSPNTSFRSLAHARWRRELSNAGFGDIRVLYCEPTRTGFRIADVKENELSRLPHVWIAAQKKS